jgi:hypothetical protein
MEVDAMEIVELELKYCECCGGLWLRRKGEAEVYCVSCLPKMEGMAAWRPRKRPELPALEEGYGCTPLLAVGEGGEA